MCENLLLLVIFNIVNKVIVVLKIFLPFIIMVMGSIDLVKAVVDGNPDTIKKTATALVYRFVASVVIFFLPSIVFTAMSMNDSYEKTNSSCLLEVNTTTINKVKASKAEAALTALEEDLTYSNYNIAKRHVSKVTNESDRAALDARLEIAEEALKKIEKEKSATRLEKVKAYNEAAAAKKASSSVSSSSGGVDNVFNLPYYNQGEEAYNPVSTSVGDYKTSRCGCGYVSLAMIADGLTGSSGGPVAIIQDLYPKFKSSSACAMPDAVLDNSNVSNFGLTSTQLFPRENTQLASELKERKEKIVEALRNGYAVEVLVPGHYIVLAGIENGEITVLDPGDRYKNGKYTIDKINETYGSRDDQTGFVLAYGFKKK